MDVDILVIVIALVVLWGLRWLERWQPGHKRGDRTDDFSVAVDGEKIIVVSDAGSWWDAGLRQDLGVPGVERSVLVGRDSVGNMILELDVNGRMDAEKVARQIRAAHSMRMKPTTDWTDRDDFMEFLED